MLHRLLSMRCVRSDFFFLLNAALSQQNVSTNSANHATLTKGDTTYKEKKKLVWHYACLWMCVHVSKKDLMSDILPIVKLEPGFLGWREEDDMVIYKIQALYAKLLLVRTAQPEERICKILSNVPLILLNQHRPPVFDVYFFFSYWWFRGGCSCIRKPNKQPISKWRKKKLDWIKRIRAF